jgi:hypothetical protein
VALSGALAVGDYIRIRSPNGTQGPPTNFVQEVTAIYVDGESRVRVSKRTGTIQIVVMQNVREKDVVYRILITSEPPPADPPPEPPDEPDEPEGPGPIPGGSPVAPSSSSTDPPSLPDPSDFPPSPRKKKGRGIGG